MPKKKRIYFVFGKHMHWTGMVWEWGEDVMEKSVEALERVVRETGLKAGLNFDGRGIEHLAVTSPKSIETLKRLLDEGSIEIWGGTYTQPYGGLIGHESNIMQRTFGIRAFERILGVKPEVFCEEEFDFFPQMPQLLNQLGYKMAMLFPQHTWHTPTVPCEEDRFINWRGADGSTILTIPYSRRCLMRGIPTAIERARSLEDGDLMVTWLEMLDKPNWMWSTDFALSYLKPLMEQDDFEIIPTTLREYADLRLSIDDSREIREVEYTLDDVYHGICVGKNGDYLPGRWVDAEEIITSGEKDAAWASMLGQPYPQFSSYPEWHLNRSWQLLCESQGHDAYECEGLTSPVGYQYAASAANIAIHTILSCRNWVSSSGFAVRQKKVRELDTIGPEIQLPGGGFGVPKGWRVVEPMDAPYGGPRWSLRKGKNSGTISHDPSRRIQSISLQLRLDGEPLMSGYEHAITLPVRLGSKVTRFRVDSPFGVIDAHPNGEWLYRQPTGHWLTSEQEDKFVKKPITHLSFVAMDCATGTYVYLTSQNMLSLAKDDGIDAIVGCKDSWDGDHMPPHLQLTCGIAHLQKAENVDLLNLARRYSHHKSTERSMYRINGPAFVTGVRKVGEELEMRLFETEGEEGEAEIEFLWDVEAVRTTDPFGVDYAKGPMAQKRCEFEGKKIFLRLKPREIVTLRILFLGKRTEYLDIERHRKIWVG